jgi:hypothetical protein
MKRSRLAQLVACMASAALAGAVSAQEPAQTVQTDGTSHTAAYWKFADGSGPIAADDGSNGLSGTLVDFPSTDQDHGLLPGTNGWSSENRLDFNGAGYVSTPLSLGMLANSSFTLEAYVTHNDAKQNWSPIFGTSDVSGKAAQGFFVGKSRGNGTLNINFAGLGEFTATVPGDDLTDGRVHRIAVVFNASAKTINLYYDGSKIYTKSGVTGQLTASSNLTIGGIGSDFTQRWNGSISNARVTLGALKPSQFLSVPVAPKNLIIDTDMSSDCDDVGALAIAHQFANMGEANILAIMVNDGDPYTPACVDAINTYYGRPNIPIGVGRNLVLKTTSPYTEAVAKSFPNSVIHHPNLPDAVTLYRKILSQQPDHSVVMVSVGATTNVSNLLKSSPDRSSPLAGVDLVNQKVSYLSVMGGVYPNSTTPPFNFAEFNFTTDATATLEVVTNFPRPIIFDGFEIGVYILTGHTLYDPQKNPVCMAYQLYVGPGKNRNTWDPSAVFAAVRGLAGVWKVQTGGSLTITDAQADDAWVSSPVKNQLFLVQYAKPSVIAATIEQLITAPPVKP